MPAEYHQTQVGSDRFWLMNLDHPAVEQKVMAEMEEGVEVYYDRRWGATAVLTDWLAQNLSLVTDQNILILGAGVGAETLLLGNYGKHVWLNDLAPTALELCAEQMTRNKLSNFTLLEGRYEQLNLPKVDLVVGSFLIYNDETHAAMENFLRKHEGRVILVNERLAPFPKFLKNHDHEIVFEDESGAVGVLC
ncbi:methyltransferase domain-containing protein [Roseibacillus persicicus]|uniref:class I SAM-dependent methyltransferase n=1 Tax=Roseibacillus persicicus TaxID=454148 RepID=UPI00398AB23F